MLSVTIFSAMDTGRRALYDFWLEVWCALGTITSLVVLNEFFSWSLSVLSLMEVCVVSQICAKGYFVVCSAKWYMCCRS